MQSNKDGKKHLRINFETRFCRGKNGCKQFAAEEDAELISSLMSFNV